MLKLSTAYSRKQKVGDLDFSSQGFHASVEQELSDALSPDQIKARIHDMAVMLRQAVEDELSLTGVDGRMQPVKPAEAGTAPAQRPSTGDKASNKQVKFITDLAGQRGIAISDLNADIRKRYGVGGLYDLSRKQASDLLDFLNGKQRKAA
jgi:hypothetical protein